VVGGAVAGTILTVVVGTTRVVGGVVGRVVVVGATVVGGTVVGRTVVRGAVVGGVVVGAADVSGVAWVSGTAGIGAAADCNLIEPPDPAARTRNVTIRPRKANETTDPIAACFL
jgi:hypothetical protein